MAIKKRILEKLDNINMFLEAQSGDISQNMHLIVEALGDAQQLCEKGLPDNSYVKYDEYYTSLVMAFEQILSGEAASDIKEIISLCREILQHIVTETANEDNFKKEFVFLPYKYSMWDSLESIWRASDEDRDKCLAYVVPIPYCDLNQDGTVKEWHCEKDSFPVDIPTLDWKNINLEQMHPDAIFCHNPYDNYNKVTSVDSHYYSGTLKNQTELLVYVPYFLTAKRWPELHTNLPIYHNMDFMVVQKDRMEIAPRQFSNIKENAISYLDEYIPSDKLMPLGSPKIDKIFYCEHHPNVPKEWLDTIARRKVIFFNTSISGILQHGQRFLNKMKYIFDTFSHRKDVVLLWRPHPLMESCVHSMRPDLYEGYMALKHRFLDEQIGIYDETPDLEMTMAVCDGYLGEASSSVVSLFGYAGKPIFLIGDWMLWKEPSEAERQAMRIGTHLYDDKFSYFLSSNYNIFCRMSRENGKIETLIDFGRKPDSKEYCTFIRDEDDHKFYFSPNSAKSICIYDETTGERRDIPYDNPLEEGNFGGMLQYENFLYFLPSRYPALVRLNKKTGELTYYRECLQEILPLITAKHMELIGGCAWLSYPNKVYLSALQSNRVMTFNLSTGDYSWQAVGPDDTDCCVIIEEKYGSGIFWLFPWRTKKIRRWNTHTGECEVLGDEAYPEDYNCQIDWWNGEDQYKFSGIFRLDSYIWLLPSYGNMALRLDMSEMKLEKIDMKLPFSWEQRKSNYFLQQTPINSMGAPWLAGYRPWDEDPAEWVIQFSYDNRLYWYNFLTCTYREQPCVLTAEQLGQLTPSMKDSFSQVWIDVPYATIENRAYRSINKFLDYVKSGIHDRGRQCKFWSEFANNVDGTCGEKVKEEVLRRLR